MFVIREVCDLCGDDRVVKSDTVGEVFKLALSWVGKAITARLNGVEDDTPLRTRCSKCAPMQEQGKETIGPGSAVMWADKGVKPS